MQPNYLPMETGVYDAEDEWIACPECRSVMYRLATYELPDSSEFPAVEMDFWELIVWGWAMMIGKFIAGLITYKGRNAKLAQLKRNVLPRYPHSFVCPRCLTVARRV
ncbi:MAG: hypothetical protein ABIY70_17910 [Capsulimonas sp.]|uniref:hypothetical protein n=1 Tax=Capsulimonas sp. TaxID=2494211 RepID=UPI003267CCE5